MAGELASMPNVRLMTRTTVIGAFDHGIYGAVEQVTDHPGSSARRQGAAGADLLGSGPFLPPDQSNDLSPLRIMTGRELCRPVPFAPTRTDGRCCRIGRGNLY